MSLTSPQRRLINESDRDTRELERRANAGDAQAMASLNRHRQRSDPYLRYWQEFPELAKRQFGENRSPFRLTTTEQQKVATILAFAATTNRQPLTEFLIEIARYVTNRIRSEFREDFETWLQALAQGDSYADHEHQLWVHQLWSRISHSRSSYRYILPTYTFFKRIAATIDQLPDDQTQAEYRIGQLVSDAERASLYPRHLWKIALNYWPIYPDLEAFEENVLKYWKGPWTQPKPKPKPHPDPDLDALL